MRCCNFYLIFIWMLCYNFSTYLYNSLIILFLSLIAEVAEWQTRWTQNPFRATECGFKSRLRHHSKQSIEDCFFSEWWGGTWCAYSRTQTLFAPHLCWVRHTLVKIEKFVFQFSRHSLSRRLHHSKQCDIKTDYATVF